MLYAHRRPLGVGEGLLGGGCQSVWLRSGIPPRAKNHETRARVTAECARLVRPGAGPSAVASRPPYDATHVAEPA